MFCKEKGSKVIFLLLSLWIYLIVTVLLFQSLFEIGN